MTNKKDYKICDWIGLMDILNFSLDSNKVHSVGYVNIIVLENDKQPIRAFVKVSYYDI